MRVFGTIIFAVGEKLVKPFFINGTIINTIELGPPRNCPVILSLPHPHIQSEL